MSMFLEWPGYQVLFALAITAALGTACALGSEAEPALGSWVQIQSPCVKWCTSDEKWDAGARTDASVDARMSE